MKKGLTMKDIENLSIRDAFGEVLVQLGEEFENLVLLGADAINSTRGAAFARKFPHRTFNFGVAEANMVGVAAGLAMCGFIPMATAYAFLISMRACEQVQTDICYHNLNVKLIATHGGLSFGTNGPTHHSIDDIAIMRSFPNITVVVPADAYETTKAARAVIEHNGPVYLRLGRGRVPAVYKEDYQFVLKEAITLKEGNDLAIIACGVMVGAAVEAALALKKEGIEARVINMHTIKPIDRDAIVNAAKETGKIITAEEHNIVGGLGDAVASVICEEGIPVKLVKIGIRDTFCVQGSPEELLHKYGLDSENIVKVAKRLLSCK